MGSRVISCRLPDDLAKEFEQFCANKGITPGDMLKKVIDDIVYPSGSEPSSQKAVVASSEVDQRLEELEGQAEYLNQELEDTNSRISELAKQLPDINSRLSNLETKVVTGEKVNIEALRSEISQLKDEISRLEARSIDDFTPQEKRDWLIGTLKRLSPEAIVELAHAANLRVAKAEEITQDEAEGKEPVVIKGKTTKPGYRYYPHLDASIREGS